jgi:hypothetical protein
MQKNKNGVQIFMLQGFQAIKSAKLNKNTFDTKHAFRDDIRRSVISNRAGQLPIQVVQTHVWNTDRKTTRKYYLAVRPEDFDSTSEVLNLVSGKTQSD